MTATYTGVVDQAAGVDCRIFLAGAAGARAGPVMGTASPTYPAPPYHAVHSHATPSNSTERPVPPVSDPVFRLTCPSSLMTFDAPVTCVGADPPLRHCRPVPVRYRSRTSSLGEMSVHVLVLYPRQCCTSGPSSDCAGRRVPHSASSQVPSVRSRCPPWGDSCSCPTSGASYD